ncbi:patched domain-containing protein 3-like [Centruroides vittatus]|uniref:patched domain-containing protein 3-like n=1 Tax=Centruroides vittatus TaxID=120091 RepID=UPI003510B2FF
MRFTEIPNGNILFFIRRNGGNILEREILQELQVADFIAKNCTIQVFNRTIGYDDICVKVRNKCYENVFFEIMSDADDVVNGKKKFKYPVDIDTLTYSYRSYVMNLGGVTIDENDYVKSVEAVRLFYVVDRTDEEKATFIDNWIAEVYRRIQSYNFQNIKPLIHPLWSMEEDNKAFLYNLKYMIGAVVSFICVFSMITLMSQNLIRSKPWMGLACVLSAGMAIVTSFGLMGYCGVENTYCNICIPFLVLVTEVDDSFVLIASWRTTDPEEGVQKRMADTFAAAGVSITLTSITNLFSYCIGISTPIVVVKIFCIYSATCIFFTYVFQITFFAGCMALSGYREEKGLHPISFKSYAREPDDCQRTEENEDFFLRTVRDKLGNFIIYTPTKLMVLILYFVNLGFGCYGVYFLKQGLDLQNINRWKIFLEDLSLILHIAESRFTVSWLKYYKEFQRNPVARYALRGYNMSNKNDFMEGLREVFLRFKAAEQFSDDLVFSQDGSEITCSRFFVIAKKVSNRETEIATMNEFSKIADEAPFPVLIHHVFASMIEQGVIIAGIAKQLFWITGLLIAIVFFSVIPNIFCSLVVATSVVSTTIETLGYMSMWGVHLDIMSLTSLDSAENTTDCQLVGECHSIVKEITTYEFVVALFVWYLASGDYQISQAFAFRMGRSTVCTTIKETCEAIWNVLAKEYLKFPSREEFVNLAMEFSSLCWFYRWETYTNGGFGGRSDGGIFSHLSLGRSLETGKLDWPQSSPISGMPSNLPYFMVGDEAFPLKT